MLSPGRRCRASESLRHAVRHHASARADTLTDGGLSRPEALSQGFADNGHRQAILRVVHVEISAVDQPDARRVKEAAVDGTRICDVGISIHRRRHTIDVELHSLNDETVELQKRSHSDSLDTWQPRDRLFETIDEQPALRLRVVPARHHQV